VENNKISLPGGNKIQIAMPMGRYFTDLAIHAHESITDLF
jgi:hypothetical protein